MKNHRTFLYKTDMKIHSGDYDRYIVEIMTFVVEIKNVVEIRSPI